MDEKAPSYNVINRSAALAMINDKSPVELAEMIENMSQQIFDTSQEIDRLKDGILKLTQNQGVLQSQVANLQGYRERVRELDPPTRQALVAEQDVVDFAQSIMRKYQPRNAEEKR